MRSAARAGTGRRSATGRADPGASSRSLVAIAVLLAALTLAVHAPSIGHDFTNFDDDVYVTESTHVRAGLSAESVAWAFTTFHGANWHPLTWISLMLDTSVGGVNPHVYHATSVLLHLANVLLLFYVLARMTGAVWSSAMVAALFGVHPLHVESVAWIAERKDVLSTFFLLATLLAYVRWVKRPQAGTYAVVLASFAAGLMAKPMLVTLPVVLLLLDFWPLGRAKGGARIVEKAPLFLLALASGVVTLVAQHRGGALRDFEHFPLMARLGNAAIATLAYLGKTIWPIHLSVFYPYPRAGPYPAAAAGAAIAIAALTGGAIVAARRWPWVTVGWLWYLVTLAPVLGIVQVGSQRMADRYTYVPLIGVFVALVWTCAQLVRSAEPAIRKSAATICAGLGALALAALSVVAFLQGRHWSDGVALFTHALRVDPSNALAENDLGGAWFLRGDLDRAAEHFEKSHALDPDFPDAAANLAVIALQKGQVDRAIELATGALRRAPEHPVAHSALGLALLQAGRRDDAIEHLRRSLRVRPDHAGTNAALGAALLASDDVDEAIAVLDRAARLAPDAFETRFYLGAALVRKGRFDDAAVELTEALRMRPADAAARQLLDAARARTPVRLQQR